MTTPWFRTASWYGVVPMMALLGCTPRNELASYSNGVAPEEHESLQPAEASPDPTPERAPEDPAAPVAVRTTAEDSPTNAALEPAAVAPDSADVPAASASPAVFDTAAECRAIGGFTIPAALSCYRLGEGTSSWYDARASCQMWGGDLVVIRSDEEGLQLAESVDGSAWLGATDEEEEGTFRWVGGDDIEYMGWRDGQPNNLDDREDCAVFDGSDALWSDVPCLDLFNRQVVCERLLSDLNPDAG